MRWLLHTTPGPRPPPTSADAPVVKCHCHLPPPPRPFASLAELLLVHLLEFSDWVAGLPLAKLLVCFVQCLVTFRLWREHQVWESWWMRMMQWLLLLVALFLVMHLTLGRCRIQQTLTQLRLHKWLLQAHPHLLPLPRLATCWTCVFTCQSSPLGVRLLGLSGSARPATATTCLLTLATEVTGLASSLLCLLQASSGVLA